MHLYNIMFRMYTVFWYGVQMQPSYTSIPNLRFSNEMQFKLNFVEHTLTPQDLCADMLDF